ncbi:hypothetical protein Poli38472_011298 [Pythium oligandrum]|uniref:Long-chain-fatty-acid--CoA ligase n=1 Tax=Pythium oligandrum TaxID=41045 RepID=A0A8K1FRK8_PYTOL|nr:hypothetical protein Poli38472_011298 [Pythium oligandrum]|eukprot:TMW67678.1 hypothetical protein Poli38472_011298 [Pythium oligandrum]
MGGTNSVEQPMSEIDFASYKGKRYAQELPDTKEEKRGPIYVSKQVECDPKKLTSFEVFLTGRALDNGTRRCYGTRNLEDGEYEWMTYNDVYDRMAAIAAGLKEFAGLERQNMVGIYSKNRAEWCLSAHACDRMAYVHVPIYDTLGADVLPFIVNHAELTTLFCSRDLFDTVIKCKDECQPLKYIVQFEEVDEEQQQVAEKNGLQIKSLREIEEMGEKRPIPADPPLPEDIATLCYTSGTTGNPKGVVLLHKTLAIIGVLMEDRLDLPSEVVHISYLPLAHVFEHAVLSVVLRVGGCVGFYQGDVHKLTEDIAALRPTVFVSVPRLLNRIYDKITQGVESAGGIKKLMFDQGYAAKKEGLKKGSKTHAVWDCLVFSRLRQVLGGRVNSIFSGSAPLDPEVKDFYKIVFGCDVYEGYGLSETAAGLTVPSPDIPSGPHVGFPLANTEVRLEDVPEMGYKSSDKPRPRGEILCRGATMFSGYYKDEENTAKAMDEDGWFHTGDIGCWNADGTLTVIDRMKNIFKLSQGEYVAAEKIENVYSKSKYVSQIFVYGDSSESVLVGVAVPDRESAEAWGKSKGKESAVDKLAKDSEFQKEVMDDIVRVGKEEQLRGFEFVKKLHLSPEAFSADNGLATPTMKLKRPQLKDHFQEHIDDMYSSLKH